jgi:4-diphosphocytidyl-2-C-methyl-D-erythritol kinase
MIKTKAFAKLNLNLHVLSNFLPNNCHEIKFINCQINFFDNLTFKNQKNKIEINFLNQNAIPDKDNLIYKVAILLKNLYPEKNLGVKIDIKKNIPITGGLAGGSSDAAVTFKALNKLWDLKLTNKELIEFAHKLGTDICYLIKGGVCELSGDGSVVKPLSFKMPKIYLVIIYPLSQKPSTGFMYQNLNPEIIGQNLFYLKKIKSALKNKNKKNIINNLFNDFEVDAIKLFPEISNIKKDLKINGAKNSLLLGSGLGVAGFYLSKSTAQNSFDNLSKKYKQIFITNTI